MEQLLALDMKRYYDEGFSMMAAAREVELDYREYCEECKHREFDEMVVGAAFSLFLKDLAKSKA